MIPLLPERKLTASERESNFFQDMSVSMLQVDVCTTICTWSALIRARELVKMIIIIIINRI